MIEYLSATETGALPAVKIGSPFKCVVIIENPVSPERQMEISRWLVHQGCLFMMAWGLGCSSWDDSVDIANLMDFDFGNIPDDQFVMTTWHEKDSLAEVFHFAKYMTAYSEHPLNGILILHINGGNCEEQYSQMYQQT